MKSAAICVLLLGVVLAAGCSKSDTAPTSSTPTTQTEIIVGSVDVRGSNQYGFSVIQAGTVTVTLASVTAGALGLPVGSALSVGLGDVVSETQCNILTSQNLAAALKAQISTSMTTGPKCVQVADPGNLTATVNFAIRLVHP